MFSKKGSGEIITLFIALIVISTILVTGVALSGSTYSLNQDNISRSSLSNTTTTSIATGFQILNISSSSFLILVFLAILAVFVFIAMSVKHHGQKMYF